MKSQTKPNIVFFFTDDQRFDTIAALGNTDIHTPNIDTLVQTGTTFTNAYIMGGSSPAVCMPSRAMLNTSRTLWHIDRQGQEIPTEHITLGETLQNAGYTTFGTGKWHNGPASYARSFTAGAEIFFGGMDDHWNVPACDFTPDGNYPPPQKHRFDPGTGEANVRLIDKSFDHVKPGKHSSELFCQAANNFLDTYSDDKPFYMYISFMAPHDPRTMPWQYLKMYDPETIPLPENFRPEHPFDTGAIKGMRDEDLAPHPRTESDTKRQLCEYYAMITHLDAQIGTVIDKLKATGQYDNTIFILAGDNGLALGQHGLFGKQNNYEHSIHVPLIFAGPGIPKNTKTDSLCYLIDIYPTLCDLINAATPNTVQGLSLTDAMNRPNTKLRDYLHFAYTDLHRAIRDDRYKLIEYVVNGKKTTQLFDLAKDPQEMYNIADTPEMAGTLQRLRTELAKWQSDLGDNQDMGNKFWKGYYEKS